MEIVKHWTKMSKEELKNYLFGRRLTQKNYSKQTFRKHKDHSQPREAYRKFTPSIKVKKTEYTIFVNRLGRKASIVFESQRFDSSNMGVLYNSIPRNILKQFLSHFGQRIVDYPENADLYYYRGLAHLKMGNLEQSISDLKNALRANVNHTFAKNKLNEVVNQKKEIEENTKKLRGEGTVGIYTMGGGAHGDDSPG